MYSKNNSDIKKNKKGNFNKLLNKKFYVNTFNAKILNFYLIF